MHFSTLAFLAPLLSIIPAVLAKNEAAVHPTPYRHGAEFEPDVVLRVTNGVLRTSTCLPREAVLVNGMSPGPALHVPSNVTTWIRVYNDMDNANLTMHWHGLTQSLAPFSDGTPAAAQWPIPPLHFFDYELHPLPEAAGSYFYHSHVGFQASSCMGALLVLPPPGVKEPYDYISSRVMLLGDVFAKNASTITAGLTAVPFVWSGEVIDVLVNGRGRTNFTATNTTTGGYGTCASPIEVIHVHPDETYRFRIIGGTSLSFVKMAFQGHSDLTVIETDGTFTQRTPVNFLQVGSGERYSLLFNTKTEAEIRARVALQGKSGYDFYVQLETRDRPTTTVSYAILRYKLGHSRNRVHESDDPYQGLSKHFKKHKADNYNANPPAAPVLTLGPTVRGYLDGQLNPLTNHYFPATSEVTRRITLSMNQYTNGSIYWAQNGIPWTDSFPKEPYLVTLYGNGPNASTLSSYERALNNGGLDPVTRTFPVRIGEVIDLVLQNTGSSVTHPGNVDVHPFHKHGGHYWDLGTGNGTYDSTVVENRLSAISQAGFEPARRDSTMVYKWVSGKVESGSPAGWRAWRFRVEEGDAGVWMLHCHILQHMLMGMQTVWVMGDTQDIMKIPSPMVDNYLTYGGSVMGNSSHDPVGVTYFDP